MVTAFTTASTRQTFGETLVELGRENQDIVVLGGDLNKSTFANLFGREFPERFFDFGPAEQNIMGVAAGLAASRKSPFVTTFAVFGSCRPFDQIRVSIAQPHLNVKIVCTHAGIITGEDGMSAHSIEDLALMCSLPGFTVLAPADAVETVRAIRAAAETPGPFYIRLYRPATPIVHQDNGYDFKIGKAELMRRGKNDDVTIIAVGVGVSSSLQAASALAEEGTSCRVVNMHTLRPVDEGAILEAAKETGAIVTVEEHYIHGGLGSIVAQALGKGHPVPLEMVALDRYAESGTAEELLEKYHLTPEYIGKAVKAALARK
ncbi:MAG: transketolase family protein [Dehalococcoidia bacterium]|nr:transketolase family protein [Dehalococcoidia bacterium]